jgi:hypothetical protein
MLNVVIASLDRATPIDDARIFFPRQDDRDKPRHDR